MNFNFKFNSTKLTKHINFFYKININNNFINLNKIYFFLTHVLKKKGKILFILPNEKQYFDINNKFIVILKKYKQWYILPKAKSKNKVRPGLLTNLIKLNLIKSKKYPDVIFIFNTNKSFTENIIKESLLLKIPIVSITNFDFKNKFITYSLILKPKLIFFYYIFVANLLRSQIKTYNKKK